MVDALVGWFSLNKKGVSYYHDTPSLISFLWLTRQLSASVCAQKDQVLLFPQETEARQPVTVHLRWPKLQSPIDK